MGMFAKLPVPCMIGAGTLVCGELAASESPKPSAPDRDVRSRSLGGSKAVACELRIRTVCAIASRDSLERAAMLNLQPVQLLNPKENLACSCTTCGCDSGIPKRDGDASSTSGIASQGTNHCCSSLCCISIPTCLKQTVQL